MPNDDVGNDYVELMLNDNAWNDCVDLDVPHHMGFLLSDAFGFYLSLGRNNPEQPGLCKITHEPEIEYYSLWDTLLPMIQTGSPDVLEGAEEDCEKAFGELKKEKISFARVCYHLKKVISRLGRHVELGVPIFRLGGLSATERFVDPTVACLYQTEEQRYALMEALSIETELTSHRSIGITVVTSLPLPPFNVLVGNFKPNDKDRLDKHWVSSTGEQRSLTLPAYSLVNPIEAAREFGRYLRDNLSTWASGDSQAIGALAALHNNSRTSQEDKDLCALLLYFALAAGTAVRSDDDGQTDPTVDDPEHRLYREHPISRMVLAQMDSAITYVMAESQNRLVDALMKRFRTNESSHLGACSLCLAALCQLTAIMNHDATRRAHDNSETGFCATPTFMNGVFQGLLWLSERFIDYRTRLPSLEDAIKQCDPTVQQVFASARQEFPQPEDYSYAWWLLQLEASPLTHFQPLCVSVLEIGALGILRGDKVPQEDIDAMRSEFEMLSACKVEHNDLKHGFPEESGNMVQVVLYASPEEVLPLLLESDDHQTRRLFLGPTFIKGLQKFQHVILEPDSLRMRLGEVVNRLWFGGPDMVWPEEPDSLCLGL